MAVYVCVCVGAWKKKESYGKTKLICWILFPNICRWIHRITHTHINKRAIFLIESNSFVAVDVYYKNAYTEQNGIC